MTAAPVSSTSFRRDHIPTLDGLRGVAVLLVLLTHLSLGDVAPWLERAKTVMATGYLGVDIFFVLSGFLVTRVLMDHWERGGRLGQFLWRRSLRIFPAYYLLLAILAVVAPGAYLWSCVFYVSNFTDAMNEDMRTPMRHAWSLAIEEQFYLCWPALFYLVGLRRAKWLAFVAMPLVALVSLAVIWFLSRDGDDLGSWTYRLPTTRLLSLSLGCSLAFAEPWLRARPQRILEGAMGCIVLAALVIYFGHFRWHVPSGVDGTVGFAMVSTTTALVALLLHTALPRAAPLLANPPLRFLGRISYGLYLYHFPIYIACGVRYLDDHPSLTRILLAPAITFAVATVSFYAFERPILEARDRIPTPVKLWKRFMAS